MSSSRDLSHQSRAIVSRLKQSQVYRDYQKAFGETIGLPLNLRPLKAFDLSFQGSPEENPFCALMAQTNQTCSACLQLQGQIEEEAQMEPKTLKCFAGLCDSAVPVRVGDGLVAFLQTGQILLHQPTKREFTRTTQQLLKWGAQVDLKRLEEAYFQTRVLTKVQYNAILQLLTVFSQHLATLSTELLVKEQATETPAVAKARSYIETHQDQEISLNDVARAVNMSAFYFCKTFKKSTGMTFTDYLSRVRVAKVKNLLLNPHKRISEAAYEAGFQSLSQFNRVFRKITGESPSAYRERLVS